MRKRDLADAPISSTSGMPFRALLLSIILMPVCCFWAGDSGVDRIFSLMVPPVSLTLLLIVINIPLRRYLPRAAFTQKELVIFFSMQAVACAISSEWLDVINPYMYSYGLYAKVSPDYQTKVLPYISSWLFFKNANGLHDFRNGGYGFMYFLGHLGIWWPKIFAWTLIVTVVCFAMLCINSLMRDEWTNREKLAFPIIQLPIAMTQEGGAGAFWKSRWMWGAFIVIAIIDLLNGFAFFHPSLPMINVRFLGDMSLWFPSPPWNQIGWTPIGLFPFIAAIGLFMPTDLLFSLIFFFFFRKAQQVIAASLGYEQGVFGGGGLVPSPPYFSEQSWGAFIGLFVTAIWVSRGYLRELWEEIRMKGTPDKRLVPQRFAFIGLLASMAALGFIGWAIGLPFYFVVGYEILFLIFSVALTRLRAQLGPPTHEMAFMGPNQLLVDFHGTEGVSSADVARTVTTFYFMNRIHRTDPMPDQLEAIKMGENTHVNQRWMFFSVILATVLGSILGHLVRIYLGYRWTPTNTGGDTTGVITQLTGSARGPNYTAIAMVVAGFAFVMLLDFIRFRVPGFPFHPAGYALAMNFGVDYYWFGLLVVLIVKVLVQRYYGLKGYEKLRMVAFGLILGEFVIETLWSGYSMWTHTAAYSISINGRMGWNQ